MALMADRNCDRSSGRSRIGTTEGIVPRSGGDIAIVLRGDRGLEHSPSQRQVE